MMRRDDTAETTLGLVERTLTNLLLAWAAGREMDSYDRETLARVIGRATEALCVVEGVKPGAVVERLCREAMADSDWDVYELAIRREAAQWAKIEDATARLRAEAISDALALANGRPPAGGRTVSVQLRPHTATQHDQRRTAITPSETVQTQQQ